MKSQRTLLGVLALLAVGSAVAQVPGVSRWLGDGAGYYGLRAERADFRLNLQAGSLEASPMDRILSRSPAQGLNIKYAGRSGLANDLAVYGRVTSLAPRSQALGAGMAGLEGGGLAYGVGLSWDFSRRGSATFGFDSYDFRTAAGERDVRATSLGLQWRY